jgi:hypothetical protein
MDEVVGISDTLVGAQLSHGDCDSFNHVSRC